MDIILIDSVFLTACSINTQGLDIKNIQMKLVLIVCLNFEANSIVHKVRFNRTR